MNGQPKRSRPLRASGWRSTTVSWPITIAAVATPSRPWRISSGRDNRRPTGQPIGKRSRISPGGWSCCQHLPDAPERTRHELDVQITLGQALIATKGQAAPEVEQAFTRARALCEQVGETPQLFAVLGGLRMMYEVRGELPQARELAEQLLSLAQREQDPARLMRAYNGWGRPCSTWESSPRRERTSNREWPWMIPRGTARRPSASRPGTSQGSAAGVMPPGPCGIWAIRSRRGSGAMRPSRWPRSWRIPIAWPMLCTLLPCCTACAARPRLLKRGQRR